MAYKDINYKREKKVSILYLYVYINVEVRHESKQFIKMSEQKLNII